ncbi:MAG: hypothetical protein ABIY71_06445 [Flavobacteriales bacterium]
MSEEKWYVRTGSTLLALLCLLSAAIWNGYPIVYSDTSSYLASGFYLETLVDRPITYGLFIRVCSFNGWSLWTVVIAQSMLLAYVIGLLLRSFGIRSSWSRSLIIGSTALVTGLSFVSGQIITDVFTPILAIALFLLLFIEGLPKRSRVLLFGIFLLSFAMHMSHVSITVLLLLLALVLNRVMQRTWPNLKGWYTVAILLLLSVGGTLVMGVSLAKSKYTFYAAHMAEIGVLQKYLEEHCATERYQLCERLGSIPRSADLFLWAEDSPLKVYQSRKEMEVELGRIVTGSLKEPALLWMQITSAFKATGKQLTHFAVGDGNGSFGEGTLLHERIALFIPSEVDAFDNTRQMGGEQFRGPVLLINWFHSIAMILSLFALGAFWLFFRLPGRSNPYFTSATIFLISTMIINAGINASLVMVADRFGTKLAWLLPFLAITSFALIMINRAKTPRST